MSLAPPRFRRAFTLIELLVVMAIIGVLVSRIVPAVQAARESARRTQCVNNLKQIGIALQEYHDGTLSFPDGRISMVCGVGGGSRICHPQACIKPETNVTLAILPYLDQRSMFDGWNFSLPINDPLCFCAGDLNMTGRAVRLNVYQCPSDPVPRGVMSYRGVTGSIPYDAPALEDYGDPRVPDGVFFTASSISISDITDGTSTTALFTERLQGAGRGNIGTTLLATASLTFSTGVACTPPNSGPAFTLQGMSWLGGYSNSLINFTRRPNAIQRACLGTEAPTNTMSPGAAFDGPSSMHPGGVNMVMADGSVRFITDRINVATWTAFATISGGETISSDSF